MLKRCTVITMLAAIALGLEATPARASGQSNDVVIEWNQILQANIPATAGLQAPRYYAMLHVAMFDAINAIERQYRPFRVHLVWALGSSEAAGAQAARDILVALIPAGQSTFDAALEARLSNIPRFQARLGANVGHQVAAGILAWRQNDGWATPPPAFVLPPIPGLWQPTPPANAAAAFTQFPHVTPFALLTPTQYLPAIPPTLTSERYATDFNEVKAIGSVSSATRTDEQTLLARLFASVVTPTIHFALWNNVARDAAEFKGQSLVETARLFALLNVSINDGVQTSHTSKFVFALWRPVTAIRRAAEDLNPGTEADPSWSSLIITPPYPSYSGNMACTGTSAARALALGLGTDEVPFTAVWRNPSGPDFRRTYDGFQQLAQDQADSRIYAGIHFRSDNEASQAVCPKVAEFVFSHFMRPR